MSIKMNSAIEILQHKYTNTNTNSCSTSSVSEIKNTNTNTKTLKPRARRTLAEVQLIAHRLEDRLGKQMPSRFEFYCKVAWELPDNLIENALEAELRNREKGKPHHRLFSYLVAQYMKR